MTDTRTAKYLARSRGQTFNYLPEDVVIVTDPDSCFYDERATEPVEQEFVDDIFELGVHTPAIVAMRADDKGRQFVGVVAGRRRFKATAAANKRRKAESLEPRTVPCIMRNDLTDDEIREIIISENEQRREDTLKNKIAKAVRSYKAAEEAAKTEGERFDAKATCAAIAVRFGVNATTIARWVQVPQLGAVARGAIYKGDIPLGAVPDLVKMSAGNQADAVAKIREAAPVGTRGARKAAADVPRAEQPKQSRRPRAAIEAKIAELEEGLSAKTVSDRARRVAHIEALKFALGEDTL